MIYRHRTSVRWNSWTRGVVSICVTFRVRFEKDKKFTKGIVGGINKSALTKVRRRVCETTEAASRNY